MFKLYVLDRFITWRAYGSSNLLNEIPSFNVDRMLVAVFGLSSNHSAWNLSLSDQQCNLGTLNKILLPYPNNFFVPCLFSVNIIFTLRKARQVHSFCVLYGKYLFVVYVAITKFLPFNLKCRKIKIQYKTIDLVWVS
jgi:hypothetical protein